MRLRSPMGRRARVASCSVDARAGRVGRRGERPANEWSAEVERGRLRSGDRERAVRPARKAAAALMMRFSGTDETGTGPGPFCLQLSVRATYRRCRDSLRRRSRRVSPRARRLRVPVHHRPSIRTERRRRRRGRRLAQTPRPSHLPLRDGNRPRRRRPRGPNPPRPSRPEAAPPARAPARSSETPRRGDARGACDRRASGASRRTRARMQRLRFASASSARGCGGSGGRRRRRTRTRLLGRAWTCDGAARRMRSPGRATPRASVCVTGDFKVLGKEQQQPDTAWIK